MSAPRPYETDPFHSLSSLIISSNFYIYVTVFQFFPPFGTFKCVLVRCRFDNCACALAETLISRLRAVILFSILYVLVHCYVETVQTRSEKGNFRILSIKIAALATQLMKVLTIDDFRFTSGFNAPSRFRLVMVIGLSGVQFIE